MSEFEIFSPFSSRITYTNLITILWGDFSKNNGISTGPFVFLSRLQVHVAKNTSGVIDITLLLLKIQILKYFHRKVTWFVSCSLFEKK